MAKQVAPEDLRTFFGIPLQETKGAEAGKRKADLLPGLARQDHYGQFWKLCTDCPEQAQPKISLRVVISLAPFRHAGYPLVALLRHNSRVEAQIQKHHC